jgi:hypothetical protein
MKGALHLDMPAPEGQIWVCAACGKTARTPNELRDTSCILHSVLCYEQNEGPMHWRAVPDEEEG